MRLRLALLVLTILLLVLATPLLAQQPSIETTSLWSRVLWYPVSDARETGGGFHVDSLWGAYLPADVLEDGDDDRDDERLLMRLEDAGGVELWRTRLAAERRDEIFSRVRPVGGTAQYWFRASGEYALSVSLDGETIARLPFRARMDRGGDSFDPRLTTRFDGPWSEWGVWHLPANGHRDALPKFQVWTLGGTHNLTGGPETISFSVVQGAEVLSVARPQVLPALASRSVWRPMDFVPQLPDAEGGGPVRTRDLLAHDGAYHVVMQREGAVVAAFPFEVRDGALVPHPRQDPEHRPPEDILLAQLPDAAGTTELIWTTRLNGADALAAVAAGEHGEGAQGAAELER